MNEHYQKDNSSFFDNVYRRHYRAVYAYLLSRVKKVDIAVDLLQDTFVKVWNHIDDLRNILQEHHIYWIINVARNCFNDHHRRLSSRVETEPINYDWDIAFCGDDPYQQLLTKETMNLLDQTIHSLPDKLRIPFILSVMGELSSSEIAGIIGCPPGTVRYRISMARKLIAQSIEAHMDCRHGDILA